MSDARWLEAGGSPWLPSFEAFVLAMRAVLALVVARFTRREVDLEGHLQLGYDSQVRGGEFAGGEFTGGEFAGEGIGR